VASCQRTQQHAGSNPATYTTGL